MQVAHQPNCSCLRCANARLTFGYAPKFTQAEPSVTARTLHSIGRVRIDVEVVRKRKTYYIYVDGFLASHSQDWPHEAFRQARIKLGGRPHKKVVGEILAYRGWTLMGDILTPVVSGAYSDFGTWSGPVAIANEIPSESNSSGLHAVKFDYTIDVFAGYRPAVHGIVGLFGRVVELERGYRSEKQIIRVLRVVPPVGDLVLKALEERYQCQVFRQKRS